VEVTDATGRRRSVQNRLAPSGRFDSLQKKDIALIAAPADVPAHTETRTA